MCWFFRVNKGNYLFYIKKVEKRLQIAKFVSELYIKKKQTKNINPQRLLLNVQKVKKRDIKILIKKIPRHL